MDTIIIRDLVVNYRVGVTDKERARPQRLLLTLEMAHDFSQAAQTDELNSTVDYDAVVRRVIRYGEDKSWKLIEKLAVDIAEMLRAEFKVQTATVEVKKFVIAETRYVAVKARRPLETRTKKV